MNAHSRLPQVGAMDPDLPNSPLAEELDEDVETIRQQLPDEHPVCYFNGQAFANDEFVRSGSRVLHCRNGVWIDAGSADPSNP